MEFGSSLARPLSAMRWTLLMVRFASSETSGTAFLLQKVDVESTIRILNQALPILFLISLGYWARHRNFLAETTIDELRKIVVNLALPAVLFISFLSIELKPSYFVMFGVIFLLCSLTLQLGLNMGC
jgi:hypothetical protein